MEQHATHSPLPQDTLRRRDAAPPEQHMICALRVEAAGARWSLTEYAQTRRAVPPNTRACREKGTYGDILL